MKLPLIKNDGEMALSFYAKVLFYNIHVVYGEIIGDIQYQYQYSKSCIEYMEKNPAFCELEIERHVIALNNYIQALILLKEYNQAKMRIKALKNISSKFSNKLSENVLVRIFSRSSILELKLLNKQGDFIESEKQIIQIKMMKKSFSGKMNEANKKIMHYEIAYAYFGTKKFREAIKYLNNITSVASKLVKIL